MDQIYITTTGETFRGNKNFNRDVRKVMEELWFGVRFRRRVGLLFLE